MLPLLGVLDARSGKWVPRGEKVRYPGGGWWAWFDSRRAGPSGLQLWAQNDFNPAGHWQDVYSKLGGLYAIYPS